LSRIDPFGVVIDHHPQISVSSRRRATNPVYTRTALAFTTELQDYQERAALYTERKRSNMEDEVCTMMMIITMQNVLMKSRLSTRTYKKRP
jgi:hypothetical protein